MNTLSILIPAYNEEDSILDILEKIDAVDLSPVNTAKELVVVDDGSTDKTAENIQLFASKHPTCKLLLIRQKNQGKGSAIRTAIKHATGDIIIIQDADLEYDPNDYETLIKPILEGQADVVYGSRRLKEGNVQYSGLSFYLGGLVLTLLANILYNTNITDEPTCYKVFRSSILKNINLHCTGFEFCPEVTAKVAKRGIEIYEVPISYFPRSVSEGKKINWKDGIEGVWTLIKYRFIE